MKEAAEEEDASQREGYRDPGGAGTTTTKDRCRRANGLHDLLSHHHRPNGKHIEVPVGNISQVKVEKVDWADQVPAFSA